MDATATGGATFVATITGCRLTSNAVTVDERTTSTTAAAARSQRSGNCRDGARRGSRSRTSAHTAGGGAVQTAGLGDVDGRTGSLLDRRRVILTFLAGEADAGRAAVLAAGAHEQRVDGNAV